jgi:peptidyl-prolyl cis-trans isomerase C
MAVTALTFRSNSWSLGRTALNGRHRGGSRDNVMGPLESSRLEAVTELAARAGIAGPIAEVLRDVRLVELMARQFIVPQPSTDACQRYYRQHEEDFREPDRVAGRQIVLPCAFSDLAARAEAWARGERLIAILHFDPGMFPDLLATYDCVTDGSGTGHIGPIAASLLSPALESAFAGLRPGQVCPVPVATERGIHVVVLDRIFSGPLLPFAAVHGRIATLLRGELRLAAARRHLARLAARHLSMAAVAS